MHGNPRALAAIAATNAATSGGTSPRNARRSGWKSAATKKGCPASSTPRTSPFRSWAVACRPSRNNVRFVLPVETVTAVVALGDPSQPVGPAKPSALRQQDLFAPLHQRAGKRRDQSQRGAGIRLGMFRLRHSTDVARVLEQGVLKPAAGAEKWAALPARSGLHPALPAYLHTDSPARTRFRRSLQTEHTRGMELVWTHTPDLAPMWGAASFSAIGIAWCATTDGSKSPDQCDPSVRATIAPV